MTIKRKSLKHGDIVEIPLKNTGKYAYGKIIDSKKIQAPIKYPLLLRIYNSIHDQSVHDINRLNRQLLLAPIWLIGQSAAISKFDWKIVYNEAVEQAEEWIPDTKVEWPLFSNPPKKWGFKKRFSTNFDFCEYDNVKHLDYDSGKNVEVVSFIIELELLKIQGKDIRKEFGIKNWLDETYYKAHKDLPIYINLPENLKGKVSK